MQQVLDVEEVDDFSKLLNSLAERSTAAASYIPKLRSALYEEGAIERRRAAEIIHVNRTLSQRDDDWIEFYLEALTSFFLKYQDNRLVLPAQLENTLFAWLGGSGSSTGLAEHRLLLRIYLRASDVTQRFEAWLLTAIEHSMLFEDVRWCDGGPRSAGVIDGLDMQLLRCLTRCRDNDTERRSSPVFAHFLMSLDRKVSHFVKPEQWRSLLVNGTGSH